MLFIDHTRTPTAMVRVHSAAVAAMVTIDLVGRSVSFYCEPLPDYEYLFFANQDVAKMLQQAAADAETAMAPGAP